MSYCASNARVFKITKIANNGLSSVFWVSSPPPNYPPTHPVPNERELGIYQSSGGKKRVRGRKKGSNESGQEGNFVAGNLSMVA